MKRIISIFLVLLAFNSSKASWYWPFGSDDDTKKIRLSDLVEQASLEIDNAVEAAAEGDMDQALVHYRKALDELDRIERENKDIAPLPEYASLRNKRAYVSTAIDSILLEQSRVNAKAVRVTNTAALEKKLAKYREEKKLRNKGNIANVADGLSALEVAKSSNADEDDSLRAKQSKTSDNIKMERKIEDAKKTPLADIEEVEKILSVKPDDAKALNLRAQIEASKGDWKSAEATLDRAIMSNPNSYYAYYNMAMLIIKFRPSSRDAARRYYETGRQLGGPVNKYLERAFK